MEIIILVLLLASGVGLFILLAKIFSTPLRWAFKLLMNTVIGFVALFIINFLGGFIGVSLGVNWINALIAGLLGIPGIALLLLLKYLI